MNDGPPRTADASLPKRVGIVVIHGNGEAETGWINPFVIERLESHLSGDPQRRLDLDDASQVLVVPDEGAPQPADASAHAPTFRITERVGAFAGGQEVRFIEMNWADLSRIGTSPIIQFLAAVRLLYEAPSVLSRAFLRGSKRRSIYHAALSRSILLAIDLLRWAISGMNGTFIVCGLLIGIANLVVDPLSQTGLGRMIGLTKAHLAGTPLAVYLIVMLLLGILVSYRFARYSDREHLGLTDVSYSTAAWSAVCAVVLIVTTATGINRLELPTDYLALAMRAVIYPWVPWSIAIAVAALLLVLVSIKRMVLPAPPDAPSLARWSGALGLAALQGAFLKIAVSVLGIAIVWFRIQTDCLIPPNSKIGTPVDGGCSQILTDNAKENLIRLQGVFTINSLIVVLAIVVTAVLLISPLLMRRVLRLSPSTIARRRPRVILSEILVAVLIGLTLLNAYVFYGGLILKESDTLLMPHLIGAPLLDGVLPTKPPMPPGLEWLDYELIKDNKILRVILIFVVMLLVVLFLNGRAQSFFSGLVHFVRDIVDHHYRPSRRVQRFHTEVDRRLPRMIAGPKRARLPEDATEYPRRHRIKARLESVMSHLSGSSRFDRILFLAHSQGTVIIHDYLRTAHQRTPGALQRADEIHVLTLASPITMLYQHYFEEYRELASGDSWLPGHLLSWSNLWRVDDPIADAVQLPRPPVIQQGLLGFGGHVDYWREPAVLDAIARLATMPMWARETSSR